MYKGITISDVISLISSTCQFLIIETACRNRFWSDETEKAERQKTQNSERKHFEKGSEREVEFEMN
jgi:hypothetical protein